MTTVVQLRKCIHEVDSKPVPCPLECKLQYWPEYMFRRSLFKRRWVMLRRYRMAWQAALEDMPPIGVEDDE